nr:unnamed protein product [Callosobruchus chinensis]
MVNQSKNSFDEDMKARSLAGAKINGNKLIHLVENNNNLSTDQKLKNLLQNAKNALQGNDLNEINNTIAELENSSLELCELTNSKVNIGKSFFQNDVEDLLHNIVETANKNNCKIAVPEDVRVAGNSDYSTSISRRTESILDGDIILDIGPQTLSTISSIIASSKTLLWNGPIGVFEHSAFASGTIGAMKVDHYFHTSYAEENVTVNFEPFFSSQPGYIPPFTELTDFDRGVLKVCGDWGAHPDKEDYKILLSCPQHQEVVKGIYDKLDHLSDYARCGFGVI